MRHPFGQRLIELQRPGRYTGGEFNSVVKPNASLRWCLVYPDVYEMGASNLGISLLYELLNNTPDVAAERAFMPWVDAMQLMLQENIPLFSLETYTPLNRFHVIGITLQTELTYTNALAIMQLAGIPVLRQQRNDDHPLIIAGGPCTGNPLPVADFFDVFVIGDGEAPVRNMMGPLMAWAKKEIKRDQALKELSKLAGVWVPDFNDKVNRSVLEELEPMPLKPPVPNISITHDRFTLELSRGCLAGCRFCQGGFYNRPLRIRPIEQALEMLEAGLRATGWDEIGLSAFTLSEYPWLAQLIHEITAKHPGIRVSVPSLPVDALDQLLPLLGRIRTSSFTLAPETGSERLSHVINKPASPDQVERSLRAGEKARIRQVKLYFMIGLPGETEQDLLETSAYIQSIARSHRKIKIKASFATFVPRPHTPFQWEQQIEPDEAKRRFALIRRNTEARNLSMSLKDPWNSALEGILARAGPEMSRVILLAWQRGALFDDWREGLRPDIWMSALEQAGLSLDACLAGKPEDWRPAHGIIDTGLSLAFLRRERVKAARAEATRNCRQGACSGCGHWRNQNWKWCFGLPEPGTVPGAKPDAPKTQQGTGLLFTIGKTDRGSFGSGNDLLRVLSRAISRAGLVLAHTQGYTPRPKLSAGPPGPVGVESFAELVHCVILERDIDPEEVLDAVNRLMPKGFEVLDCQISEKPRWADIVGVVYRFRDPAKIEKNHPGLAIGSTGLVHWIGSGSLANIIGAENLAKLVKTGYVWKTEP